MNIAANICEKIPFLYTLYKERFYDEEKEELIHVLKKLEQKKESLEQAFNYAENDDLLEALIYECKALEIRYTYIRKLAKEKKISITFLERKR